MEAATIAKKFVIYVNEARQATMNVVVSGNGNERVNVDVNSIPNDEEPAVVGDEGIKGPVLTDINKGHVSFAKMVTGEPSRKIANFHTLLAQRFSSKDRMDAMLENVPWFIRNTTLILKKWTPDANLLKEDVGNVPIWNLKNPRQDARGVQVGLKVGFKPTKQVCQPVSRKNGANTTGKKKQAGLARQETNAGWKLMLVDDDGKPLEKVDYPVNSDNDSEVEELFNEIARFMASMSLNSGVGNGSGYGTKSLLEQWRKTKMDDDYDSYDDDLYYGHDMSENLHAICDDLDIKVCGIAMRYIRVPKALEDSADNIIQ
ncbi:retrotransposon protein, putative, unclassified [Tanacetum coccineum]|uniref:Retrotransposon protein, putative, unclassified n=1 Tax=Tanacetum coccineum TaxID=301880 RepID=A0ABQ5F331_9ASTR